MEAKALSDYHGPKNLNDLCKWAQNRCKRDQNANFIVTGEPGTGKSGLVLMMALAIQPTFRPKTNVALRMPDIDRIIKRLKPGEVLDVDEAVLAGGNKRRAMEKGNKDNLDHFATDRKLNVVRFDIMPHLGEADKSVQSYGHWLLKTQRLGVVECFEPVHYGFKNLSVRWVPRFTEEFPDAKEIMPEVWGEYKGLIMQYLKGDGTDLGARQERVEKFRAVIRRELARLESSRPGRMQSR